MSKILTLRTAAAAGILAAAVAGATVTATSGGASAAQTWAPAATAKIHPGTMMYTAGAQCTANFVYTDSAANVYVGYAAHCAGTGEATDTDGCEATSLPLGTRVTFNEGGSVADEGTKVGSGTLVYSSWLTEKQLGTTDPNTCAYNDLALVKVDAADVSKVNPSIPFWGGPTGIDTDGTAAGDRVYTYGNSSLRGGVSQLSPHTGVSLGDAPRTAAGHTRCTPSPRASPATPARLSSAATERPSARCRRSGSLPCRRPTTSATSPRSSPSPSSTPASPACGWSTGPRRSTRSSEPKPR